MASCVAALAVPGGGCQRQGVDLSGVVSRNRDLDYLCKGVSAAPGHAPQVLGIFTCGGGGGGGGGQDNRV